MNPTNTRLLSLSGTLLLLSLSVTQVSATVRRVTPTGTATAVGSGTDWTNANAYGNLQTAINASSAGDTLWVKAGTYQPAVSASYIMKEGVVMLGGFNGTETIAEGRDWSANGSILKGNGNSVIRNDRSALPAMTSSSVLDGFTLTGGKVSSSGGGMYNYNASPTVRHCLFLKDTSDNTGGGMSNLGGAAPQVFDCVFKLCYAINSGGGIYNSDAAPVFTNIIVDSNATYYYGGGIANWSAVAGTRYQNIIFSNNSSLNPVSSIGGGGGGFCNIYSGAAVPVVNVVFINNHANNSYFGGGGAWNYLGTTNYTNVTFVGNSSNLGGGVSSNNSGTSNLVNCIFWNNTATTSGADIATVDIYSNPGTVNASYTFTQVSRSGTGNILGAASPFVNIASPKGADGTWMTEDDGLRPSPTAPVRDAGIATGAPATDILGKPRPGGAGFDMGAYESSLRLYVKYDASGANDGTSWANAFTSLERAIDSAKSGGEIWVAAGIYQPAIAGQAFHMKDSVVMMGGFNGTETTAAARNWLTNVTILKGNGNSVIQNDFDITNPMTRFAVLSGFTVTGGNYTSAVTTVSAGGLGNYYASPVISDCHFYNDTGTVGGAISNSRSAPLIINTIIEQNRSIVGGGISNWDSSKTEVMNSVIYNNTASGGGAGSANFLGSSTVYTNVLFVKNTNLAMAAFGGGGLMNSNASCQLINCVFTGNTSPVGGASANYTKGTVTYKNMIFWANTATTNPEMYTDGTGATTTGTYSFTQTAIAGAGNMQSTADPFLYSAYPKGPDSLWLTPDDGLQLPFCASVLNVGDTAGVAATDILGRPRINSSFVDLGAYEKQSDVVDLENNAHLSTSTANMLPYIQVCDDGEWTYYADPAMPDSLCFAIAWGTANTAAKAGAVMRLTIDAANTAATTSTDGIWAMRRYWNVTIPTTLNEPVKVRFYFNPADTIDLHAAANAWNTTYGSGLYKVGPVQWFKTTAGVPYTPSLVSATNVNGGSKVLLRPVYGANHGVAYAQFDSIASFSGGTAALGGQAGAAALPLSLIAYSAQYADNGAAVLNRWEVGLEQCRSYAVQRSTDGAHFETVGNISATQATTYSFNDVLPAAVLGKALYYRLSMIEANDNRSYSQVVRLAAGNSATMPALAIRPNPVSTSFTITGTGEEYNGHEAMITDLFGKVVATFIIADGVSVDTRSWIPGVYMLRLSGGAVYRVVKK